MFENSFEVKLGKPAGNLGCVFEQSRGSGRVRNASF